ncbi:PREDICTED: DEAD-box ATP-dependent RNA helicase 36 [Nicotiana attenuata]|uniref:Dead-box atp-dependent rna helicase 36 n=1 Tax=Nicotiana attenuata TaxID=49451 RepID=A0A314LC56_NICAT|nr:PREDICTED: DEAD-box ATP-dependent RNA helicase 36 [Nicotiana attenuata]OIT39172.1 dead-box atp-dependent rna helicase 36 [Nicotiana attenuata]
MEYEEQVLVDQNFPLFSRKTKPTTKNPVAAPAAAAAAAENPKQQLLKETNSSPTPNHITFSDLGLAEWAVQTCKELSMKKPTPVQYHCIPRILSGRDVLGLAQTGSGKTAAFALPILHRLAEDPYGVSCLVITPTRELAFQLAEQFRALGSCLNLRCAVVVGGMDMITQTKTLMQRPHVVIATPGRIKVLIEQNPDIPPVFSRTKFLVLDEADRVLDVGFEEELRAIFHCLPKNRQTLLFSATMTSNLQTLLELSANKAYFYEAYEGFKTVESLKQQYIFIPKNVKDVYLQYILSKLEDLGVRSAIIFVSTCRSCQLLGLLLEELEMEAAALHSYKSQSLRLSALHKFKSGQVPILVATDVASRGLDIPTVDLVINYDIPRYPQDYVHRVGRTARAGRGGLAVSFITQNDVDLIHEIEAVLGKQLEKFECKENEVLADITKVYKARRVASMKMMDDGFEEKAESRKAQKVKMQNERKGRNKKQKRERVAKDV